MSYKSADTIRVYWDKVENGRFSRDTQDFDKIDHKIDQNIDRNWDSYSIGSEIQWSQIQGISRGSRHC